MAKVSQMGMLLGSGASNLFTISRGRIYSPQYSIEDEAQFNARYLERHGARRIALIFFDDIFCRTHEQAFRKAFSGSVVATLSFSVFSASEIKSIVTKLLSLKVDGLYVPDATPFLLGLNRELKKVGLGAIPIVSIYSAQLNDVIKTEGEAANGLAYSYPAIGETNAVSYFPQVGANLLFNAIRKCGPDTNCTMDAIQKSGNFNKTGVLEGPIEMRMIRGGMFVKMRPE